MNELMQKIKVILSQAVTYLVLIGAVLAILVEELAPVADAPGVEWAIKIIGGLIVVIGVATAIIRRVTPVLPDERGILPQPTTQTGI